MIPPRTAETVLAEIRHFDQVQWSQPSNSLALKIMDLENEYQAITGRECPAWPQRKEEK